LGNCVEKFKRMEELYGEQEACSGVHSRRNGAGSSPRVGKALLVSHNSCRVAVGEEGKE